MTRKNTTDFVRDIMLPYCLKERRPLLRREMLHKLHFTKGQLRKLVKTGLIYEDYFTEKGKTTWYKGYLPVGYEAECQRLDKEQEDKNRAEIWKTTNIIIKIIHAILKILGKHDKAREWYLKYTQPKEKVYPGILSQKQEQEVKV